MLAPRREGTIGFNDPVIPVALANGFRLDTDKWQRYLDRSLRALVRHAGTQVPFYRRLYRDAGIDVMGFRGLADLELLPIVTRKQLQECPLEDRIADSIDPRRLVSRATSGSSGMPLRIVRTRAEDLLLQAVRLRARHCSGLRPWQRTARIEITRHVENPGRRQLTSLTGRRSLFPFRQFDAFDDANSLARSIASYQPTLLAGQPGFLERLCAEASPDHLAAIRPLIIATGGETLPSGVRDFIESVFRAPIFDYYGSHEFNLIAWQREPEAVYEMANLITLGEVVAGEYAPDPHRRVDQGEQGELVGTALWSYASPFVRYRLGDEVAVDTLDDATGVCRSLKAIRGRVTDHFVDRDGKMRHVYQAIAILLQAAPWLRRYRIEQHQMGSLQITVTSGERMAESALRDAENRINSAFGGSISAFLCLADRIPAAPNGKQPLFVRSIPLPTRPSL